MLHWPEKKKKVIRLANSLLVLKNLQRMEGVGEVLVAQRKIETQQILVKQGRGEMGSNDRGPSALFF